MKTILIVDDHRDISEIVNYILTHEGYRVSLAYDGASAFQKAVAELPNVILLDMMLPEQDGVETVRKLRERELTRDIPVIFLTALVSEQNPGADNTMLIQGKSYPVLPKTLDKNEFLKRLKKLLEDA